MNKKGQSLVIFVLILPFLALLIAFIVDSTLSLMEKNKLDGIITSNIKNALKEDIYDTDKIKKAILSNEDMEVSVSVTEDTLHVTAKSNKKSVFGELLKFKYYQLEYDYCGNYTDKKINKKCG